MKDEEKHTNIHTYIHTYRRIVQRQPSESAAAGRDPRAAVHLRPADYIQNISIGIAIYFPG